MLLKSSRFNHSCASNAELVWRKEEKEGSEIRAVSKIKAGDEVTINFDILNIGLRRISERQEILMDRWGFDCHCSLCMCSSHVFTDPNNPEFFICNSFCS